jgi:short subunit dehydrogenase-like uncharacterized protein
MTKTKAGLTVKKKWGMSPVVVKGSMQTLYPAIEKRRTRKGVQVQIVNTCRASFYVMFTSCKYTL